jgi:hypothetical protein
MRINRWRLALAFKLAGDLIVTALLATFLMALFGSEAWGASLRVTAGGFSQHPFNSEDLNESHELLAVQVVQVEAGRFINSYRKESWYLAYEASRSRGHWEGFIKSGVVYGYVDCLEPGAALNKTAPTKRITSIQEGRNDVDTSGAWCPMVGAGVRYTRYFLEPELVLVGEAVALTVSAEFNL